MEKDQFKHLTMWQKLVIGLLFFALAIICAVNIFKINKIYLANKNGNPSPTQMGKDDSYRKQISKRFKQIFLAIIFFVISVVLIFFVSHLR